MVPSAPWPRGQMLPGPRHRDTRRDAANRRRSVSLRLELIRLVPDRRRVRRLEAGAVRADELHADREIGDREARHVEEIAAASEGDLRLAGDAGLEHELLHAGGREVTVDVAIAVRVPAPA